MASSREGSEKPIYSYDEREPPLYNSELLDDNETRLYAGTSLKLNESSLAFIDVSYFAPEALRFPRRSSERKIILNSISGLMLPGLNAIMGPTGSGKTSLLDILADQKSSSRITGTVLVNGERRMKNFRFLSGYVVQDDVVMGTLSIRENLHFSAALRLPSHMTFKQRKERVETVIEKLGLKACADQRIGTEFIRGVSGGERKRTNIGMELIIEPQVLFLDEPTTGLDAHTAIAVVKLLKDLSSNGDRIIILSIHQPRYSIFKLFDTVTLLSQGNMVYNGPAGQVLNYFSSIVLLSEYEREEHDNPADFFLDIIMQCEIELKQQSANERTSLMSSNTDMSASELSLGADLGAKYLRSVEHREMELLLQSMVKRLDDTSNGVGSKSNSWFDNYATTAIWQFFIVAYRSLLNMWRNPMTNILQFFVMVVFSLIVGGIYFQRDQSPRAVEDRLGVIFFLVMSQVFGNLGAIELFIKERVAFIHETTSGYYHVSVFFIAKVFTDLIALRTIPLSVFCVITYFMIGFQASVEKFLIFYLTLALTTVAGAAVAFTFSAMVSVFSVANLMVTLVFILHMLFGGFLVGLDSIPAWIKWLKYLSVFRFASEALAINELKDQVYNQTLAINDTCTYMRVDDNCIVFGNEILKFQGYKSNWLWYDEIALAAMSVFWLTLTYIVLRVVKVYYHKK